MHVFELITDDSYRQLEPLPGAEDALLEFLDRCCSAQPFTADVKPPTMIYADSSLPEGDFPLVWDAFLVMSLRAYQSLRSLLDVSGEWLSLPSFDPPLMLFHSTAILDALDVEKSDVRYYLASPREKQLPGYTPTIREIVKYVFREEAIGDHALFREKHKPRTLWATDKLVSAVHHHALLGLSFRHIYPPPTRAELEEYYRARRAKKRKRPRGKD